MFCFLLFFPHRRILIKGIKQVVLNLSIFSRCDIDPQKIEAIQNWKAPTTAKGARGFIGFANLCREFTENFSDQIAQLFALTKKDATFRWGTEQEKSFTYLKEAFIAGPALAQWDPERQTVLEADCSGFALGGCLFQYDVKGRLRPVAYYSRKPSSAERNYPIHDKELLAIIVCVK